MIQRFTLATILAILWFLILMGLMTLIDYRTLTMGGITITNPVYRTH